MNIKSAFFAAFRFLGISRNSFQQHFCTSASVENSRKSLVGAIVGIAISLVPLLVVQVVIDGMISGITGRIIELSSYHAQLIDFGNYEDPEFYISEAERLEEFENIVSAVPEKNGFVIAVGREGRLGGTLRAVEGSFFEDEAVKKYMYPVEGSLGFSSSRSILVGKEFSEKCGVKTGDTVRIFSMKKNSRGILVPKITPFIVSGVFSSGYQELDGLWLFVPFETGYSVLDNDSSRTLIGIKTQNPYKNISSIVQFLRLESKSGFSTYSWQELNRSQFYSFQTTRMLLIFIMMLILLVASVNISSALVMMILERRKEIAILKSTGASPGYISFVFILIGLFAGISGALIGIPIGVICALNVNNLIKIIEFVLNSFFKFINLFNGTGEYIPLRLLDPAYYLEEIPVHISIENLILIFTGTVILSFLVSIVPGIKAGKEKPLEILRKF